MRLAGLVSVWIHRNYLSTAISGAAVMRRPDNNRLREITLSEAVAACCCVARIACTQKTETYSIPDVSAFPVTTSTPRMSGDCWPSIHKLDLLHDTRFMYRCADHLACVPCVLLISLALLILLWNVLKIFRVNDEASAGTAHCGALPRR